MAEGQGEFSTPQQAIVEASKSPFRLRTAMEVFSRLAVGKMEIVGAENIDKIPQGRNVVIPTTHMTDIDVPLAAKALSNRFNLGIADISEHRSFRKDPATYMGMSIAGKGNFLSVDYFRGEDGGWKTGMFNPDNYTQMEDAMRRGKAILIAAHNPRYGQHTGTLPESGGDGAVYLASKTNAIVLPVAVELLSKEGVIGAAGLKGILSTLRNRPNVRVTIGEPMEIEKVDTSAIEDVLKKRSSGEKINPDEHTRFSMAIRHLKTQSEKVMKSLSQMVSISG